METTITTIYHIFCVVLTVLRDNTLQSLLWTEVRIEICRSQYSAHHTCRPPRNLSFCS